MERRWPILHCERGDLSLWAEPLNTLSNQAFLVAALLALAAYRRSGLCDPWLLALIELTLAIFIGSTAFHSTKAAKPVAMNPAAMKPVASDVSLIDGIGPKYKKLLAAEGIASLADIAALTAAAMAKLDDKLGLKGRSARDAWIAEAKDLVAGGTPRAKSDRARAV
jgi:hypothetical protein